MELTAVSFQDPSLKLPHGSSVSRQDVNFVFDVQQIFLNLTAFVLDFNKSSSDFTGEMELTSRNLFLQFLL